jgi:hypothetical protein
MRQIEMRCHAFRPGEVGCDALRLKVTERVGSPLGMYWEMQIIDVDKGHTVSPVFTLSAAELTRLETFFDGINEEE